ncbi:MAG: flagellar basal-body rod protein FlgG [Nevskia sp.]|jgi:flagellar basal-body rod protein FlgG|nr:flagellar basal-body rod protein FlgG [Nevskia sp.]MCK9383344.1 flagellar basal-body rod protein FlgG [Nevskia sp.]
MIDSLYIGATGLNTQQVRIDTIANNVSNVNTTAFKKGRVAFADIFYRRLNTATPVNLEAQSTQVGLGTAISRTDSVFSAGDIVQTNNPLDLAIQGGGFFEVRSTGGETVYSRLGSLRLNTDGELQTQNGDLLASSVRVPPDATSITVSRGGEISVVVPNQRDPVVLGTLELANFVNPEGVRAIGGGLYAATESSGQPYFAAPGENGAGTISQGFLESSNVDLTTELIDLVVAQRAYQLNSRIVQISDQILSTIANLRQSQG